MTSIIQTGFVAVQPDADFAPLYLQVALTDDFREKAQEVFHFADTHDMINCVFIPSGVELQDLNGLVYPVTQATATNEGISFKFVDSAIQLTFETDILFFDQIEKGETACLSQPCYFGTSLNPHTSLRAVLDADLAEAMQDLAA